MENELIKQLKSILIKATTIQIDKGCSEEELRNSIREEVKTGNDNLWTFHQIIMKTGKVIEPMIYEGIKPERTSDGSLCMGVGKEYINSELIYEVSFTSHRRTYSDCEVDSMYEMTCDLARLINNEMQRSPIRHLLKNLWVTCEDFYGDFDDQYAIFCRFRVNAGLIGDMLYQRSEELS